VKDRGIQQQSLAVPVKPKYLRFALILGALSALLWGIFSIESRKVADRLDASDVGAQVVIRRAPLAKDPGTRRLNAASEIVLRGLCSNCPTQVTLTLRARTVRRAIVIVKRSPTRSYRAADVLVGPSDRMVTATVRSDRCGMIRLGVRFDHDVEGATVRIRSIVVNHGGGHAVTRTVEIVLLALALALSFPGSVGLRLIAGVAPLAASLVAPPLILHGLWPAMIRLTTGIVAWRYGSRLLHGLIGGLQPSWAAWIALGAVIKIWLATTPGVCAIDSYFHAHNVFEFGRGDVMTSLAPGPKEATRVPYPPALYAVLWPCVRLLGFGEHETELLVRLTLGFLEGLAAPLLLFALMRRRHSDVAGVAAAVLSAMPAGLLIVSQGIAANSFGQAMTLAALWALTRPAHAAVSAGLLAIVLLSHLSSAACLACLLLLWWLWEWHATKDRGVLKKRLMLLAIAGAVAFAAYYAEVMGYVFDAARKVSGAPVGVNWILVGKLAQNLWLYFGAAPLLIACFGLREIRRSRMTDRFLWYAWIATFVGMTILGATTLVAFRFDYFATPLVAVLTAFGARTPFGRKWLRAAMLIAFATQALIGVFLLFDGFNPVVVKLYSPRWSFPFQMSL
jgi:hypothetical protein